MNYSRKGTAQKEKDIKSTSKRLTTKASVSVFRIIIISIVVLVIVGCIAAYGAIKAIIDRAPSIDDIRLSPTSYKTTIYDNEGNEMDTLFGSEANRIYVEIENIPQVLQDAFVAIEDERFYEHNGVDVRGVFRAFFRGLSSGNFDEGASTITQQLIKNQVFSGGNESDFMSKLDRKIQEQYLAIKLEGIGDKAEIKKEILELYLNTINCGSSTYGVQTASQRYFNKDVSELTLSEATVIAVITNRPVYYNPIAYPEDNADRRLRCLNKMLELGYCTQQEYDEAIADTEAVYERIQAVNEEYDDTSYNTYFVDALIDQVLVDLVDAGYTQADASNLLYSGGLNIYTTQDSQVQSIVDDVYTDESLFPNFGVDAFYELRYALSVLYADGTETHYQTSHLVDYYKDDPSFSLYFVDKDAMNEKIEAFKNSVYNPKTDKITGEKITMTIQPQSSFVVMDQHTGYVVALIGGYGEKHGNRTFNHATATVGQPGSTFKILSTYLPALDTSGLTLAQTFDDAKYYYPGTQTEVKNYDTSSYKGLTTIREAIAKSMNIVAVKTLEVVSPQVGYDYLLKLGITSLVDNNNDTGYTDIAYPLALGGITKGVSNLEMTAAYSAIANSGTYNKPTLYTKIVSRNGDVLIDKSVAESRQVMKESTAWLLTNAMKDVVTSGTAPQCRFQNYNMTVVGKTGTSSKYLDTWFVGYTPYYTAGIWSGYDTRDVSQTDKNYHKNVWRAIMERVHQEKELPAADFPMPDSIETAKICKKSGKLAVDGVCTHAPDGSDVKIEYFAKGTVPTEKCDVHKNVKICKKSGKLATEFCPLDEVEEKVFLDKEETSPTSDTPYLIPTDECSIHDASTVEKEDDDIFDFDDIIDSLLPNKPNNNPEDNVLPSDPSEDDDGHIVDIPSHNSPLPKPDDVIHPTLTPTPTPPPSLPEEDEEEKNEEESTSPED